MREASVRPQSLGIVAGGHQQRSRNIGSDTDEGTKIWRHLLGEAIELGVDSRDLLGEELMAPCQRPQCHLGSGGGCRDGTRPQRRPSLYERPAGDRAQLLAK